jgi:hypothetical protein
MIAITSEMVVIAGCFSLKTSCNWSLQTGIWSSQVEMAIITSKMTFLSIELVIKTSKMDIKPVALIIITTDLMINATDLTLITTEVMIITSDVGTKTGNSHFNSSTL